MQFELKVPLLGFDSITSMELKKIDDTFMKLEAVNTDTAFTLINPFILREYAFDIPDGIKTLLEIKEESNILIYNILIVTTPIENSTINFAAPLVFNTDNNKMAQVIISDDPNLSIAEPLSNYLTKK